MITLLKIYVIIIISKYLACKQHLYKTIQYDLCYLLKLKDMIFQWVNLSFVLLLQDPTGYSYPMSC